MTTRSIVIARYYWTTAGFNPVATPPTGWTWIVKTVDIYNDNASANGVALRIASTISSAYVDIVRQSIPAMTAVHFPTWMIVEDTDTIIFAGTAAPLSLWISGTILPKSPHIGP